MTSLLDLLLDFLDWAPTVPSSPKALAQALADLTYSLHVHSAASRMAFSGK